jgi:MFS family permease
LELEARRFHARSGAAALSETGLRQAGLGETAPALVLARWPVFFDLFACSLAAVLVFPQVFFSGVAGWAAGLMGVAVAVLPLALIPLGASIGRAVGRRYGRGVGLTGGQFVLGASTTAVALLPSQAQVGLFAIFLLVGCRLVQGVSAGAAWGEAPRRSGDGDPVAAAAALGLVIGGGLMAVLARSLSAADFTEWGWRYPFAIGFVINIVGLFANLRLLAIPAASAAGDGEPDETVVSISRASGPPLGPPSNRR